MLHLSSEHFLIDVLFPSCWNCLEAFPHCLFCRQFDQQRHNFDPVLCYFLDFLKNFREEHLKVGIIFIDTLV